MPAAPAGTPPTVLDALIRASAQALATPAMRQMIERDGIDLVAGSVAEAATFLQAEADKWGKVVKQGNLRP